MFRFRTGSAAASLFANGDPATPYTERVRHDLRMRRLRVLSTGYLTPNMIRVVLGGDDLKGFTTHSPDDHIKVFIPGAGGEEETRRDYTPRFYDAQHNELTIDFAVHQAGPASAWAESAQPGDWLSIGGPRGSQIIRGNIDHWLLIGDETALPAIGRRIEELGSNENVTSVVSIPHVTDQQAFRVRAGHSEHWLSREDGERTESIIETLQGITLVPATFVWLAGESGMVRRVRQYLLQERGLSKDWIKASGYWKEGSADSSERFD